MDPSRGRLARDVAWRVHSASSAGAVRRLPHLIGVVPAAGYARRLQPLLSSKEVLRVDGAPVMDHLIERMRVGGCSDIRVVTRPEKADVIAHARELGLTIIPGHPRSVSESLLLGAQRAHPDDLVLLGFPDTVWEPIDGFARIMESLGNFEVVLGLFQGQEPQRSDIVEVTEAGIVTSIRAKPRRAFSSLIWGCAVARRRALAGFADDPEPGVVFDALCRGGGVMGLYLSDHFVDIGTIEALRKLSGAD